jgi:hypothetical protein
VGRYRTDYLPDPPPVRTVQVRSVGDPADRFIRDPEEHRAFVGLRAYARHQLNLDFWCSDPPLFKGRRFQVVDRDKRPVFVADTVREVRSFLNGNVAPRT